MFDKSFFGYLSLVFVVLSGAPYIWSILMRKTRPHVFTWVLWGLLTGIAALAQHVSNAGAGAWAASLSAVFCFVTAILAFTHGERDITRSDWATFVVGLSAIPLWYFTDSPLAAVVWVTLTDALGYYPTLRKSIAKPKEELVFSYIISNLKHITSLFAMAEYSMTNLFNPIVLLAMDTVLIVFLARGRLMKAEQV